MSKYDKVYAMLDVVAASDERFSWSDNCRCLMGIARTEGFFGVNDYRLNYINCDVMQDRLGLTQKEFDAIYTGFFVRPDLANDREGAIEWVREMIAGWETEQAIARLDVARLHEASTC